MNQNLVGSNVECMEGSILSFLKAEWKVSDTGSAHWASSYYSNSTAAGSNVITKNITKGVGHSNKAKQDVL